MLDPQILFAAVLNGLTQGAVYALVALGLTLIYGVLHIINFAHGAALMMALYGVYFLQRSFGLDPYVSLAVMVPLMFAAGYASYRWVIGRASHGKDENILLVTLGVSIVRIVGFNENNGGPIYYAKTMSMDSAGMGGAPAAPAPEIPVGQNKITSNVNITYEIR